jgi:hypothetical protein
VKRNPNTAYVPIGLEGVPPAALAAWRREHDQRADSGPEFLTTRQLVALWNVGRSTANQRIGALAAAGRIERGARRIGGHFVPTYRLIPNNERTP